MTSYDQKRYVDNIETVCETGQQAQQSLGPLQAFCDALDLQVDPKKTYCRTDRAQRVERSRYSNPESGKRLRNMTYSKWSTKGTILEKIEKFAPFWRRLSRSAAPKFQKLPCSKVSAWPNTFHSIGISSVHFEKIRTKVMQAVGLNTYGANPILQLSCICPSACDPEFWCAHETIPSWRKFTTPEMVDFVMTFGRECDDPRTMCLHKLGWQWIRSGVVHDQNHQPHCIA